MAQILQKDTLRTRINLLLEPCYGITSKTIQKLTEGKDTPMSNLCLELRSLGINPPAPESEDVQRKVRRMKDEELKAEQARRHQIELALGKLHERPRQKAKPPNPPPNRQQPDDRAGKAYKGAGADIVTRDPMNGNPMPRRAQQVRRTRQPRAQGQDTQDREAVRALGDFRQLPGKDHDAAVKRVQRVAPGSEWVNGGFAERPRPMVREERPKTPPLDPLAFRKEQLAKEAERMRLEEIRSEEEAKSKAAKPCWEPAVRDESDGTVEAAKARDEIAEIQTRLDALQRLQEKLEDMDEVVDTIQLKRSLPRASKAAVPVESNAISRVKSAKELVLEKKMAKQREQEEAYNAQLEAARAAQAKEALIAQERKHEQYHGSPMNALLPIGKAPGAGVKASLPIHYEDVEHSDDDEEEEAIRMEVEVLEKEYRTQLLQSTARILQLLAEEGEQESEQELQPEEEEEDDEEDADEIVEEAMQPFPTYL